MRNLEALEKPGGHKPNPEDIWRTLTRPKGQIEPFVQGLGPGQRTLEKVGGRETWRSLQEKPGGHKQIRRTFGGHAPPRQGR